MPMRLFNGSKHRNRRKFGTGAQNISSLFTCLSSPALILLPTCKNMVTLVHDRTFLLIGLYSLVLKSLAKECLTHLDVQFQMTKK